MSGADGQGDAVRFGRGDLRVRFRWYDADAPPELGAGGGQTPDVHVWLLRPDVGGERDASIVGPWLDASERARRERIVHPRALAEFLAGRMLLRRIFGALLAVAPRDVRIRESERGALSLDPSHGSDLHFNISHTEGLLALAIAGDRVGIDVEQTTRPGRTTELADRYFAPSETAALRALPAALQRDRFFDLWTLKEAYIKARGLGLAIPLADFAYALSDDAIAIEVAAATRDVPDDRWGFRLAQVGDAHRVALALAR